MSIMRVVSSVIDTPLPSMVVLLYAPAVAARGRTSCIAAVGYVATGGCLGMTTHTRLRTRKLLKGD